MDIGAALRQIYPEAPACEIFGGGNTPWIVRDDGGGPFLASWNYSKPKPSDDAIAAAWLVVQKNRVWEAIKEERDRRTDQGGYKAADKWFHSDQKSRSQQLGLARKADRIEATGGDLDAPMHDADGSPIAWKTMDGSFVPMTARLAQQIAVAAESSDLSAFKAAELHRAAVASSADPATYDFSSGWPAIFGE